MSSRPLVLVVPLVASLASAAFARAAPCQSSPADGKLTASGAAVVLTWNQAQRERGFAHMDSVFTTRTVHAGPRAHPLPAGRPLAAFAPGGARAAALDRYMADEKVAGILVLQDGRVRLERYALGDTPDTRWHSFSVAKSVTSTLFGAAMKDGYIRSLDDSVTRYIPALRGSAYDGVTLRELLTMTSGVRWNEDYTDLTSDVARLYAVTPDSGMDATVSYVRKLPRESPPGTHWVYKTSETNLVGVLVMAATHKSLADYLTEKIWRPYGMERDAAWMTDDIGHEQGGCCLAMTLRDYARYGQFILDGARVDGHAIVPDAWLGDATRTQVATGSPGSGYGFQWWTRDDGTFDAIGIYGQCVHIDRARRLVIAINSAAEQATGRTITAGRRAFIDAVAAEVDAGR
ncbi:MAG TPA: serine hydrolase domain-containing protein [Gemmatimonadaceae bacterium]|nr:serine hydrolase domain-containing protein [Gemmatimonadaceae bacterium]